LAIADSDAGLGAASDITDFMVGILIRMTAILITTTTTGAIIRTAGLIPLLAITGIWLGPEQSPAWSSSGFLAFGLREIVTVQICESALPLSFTSHGEESM
jgi:hypothetical protein